MKPLFAYVGTSEEALSFLKEEELSTSYDLLLLDSHASVYSLWGKRDIPYVMGKKVTDKGFAWIPELVDHERAGRIVPWNES